MKNSYSQDDLDLAKRGKKYVTPSGVYYEWWFEGSTGAGFALYREPHHSDADIVNAKQYLRRKRDVVSLVVKVPEKKP